MQPFIPPYNAFVASPPVIPKLYYDVYSQEERIKGLCKEIEKLRQYSNLLAETINGIENDVSQAIKDSQELVDKKLKDLESELKQLIEEVVGSSLDWDVTTGSLQPTIIAHRALYHWATIFAMTVEELNIKDMTVEELANCGLNCAGLAFESRNGLNNNLKNVPYEYIYGSVVN